MRKWVFIIFLICAGCRPSSNQDFRVEGHSLVRNLISELESIHTKKDLFERKYRLYQLFNQISELMAETGESSDLGESFAPGDSMALSDQLYIELSRVYEIEGAREFIEELQIDALARLDIAKGIT